MVILLLKYQAEVQHNLQVEQPKNTTGKVVLVDASKLGETIKDGKNQRTVLRPEEEKRIVDTFHAKQPVEDFAVVLDYDAIKEKNYSLYAGQYFDIKIEYVAITHDDFQQKITDFSKRLSDYFAQGKMMEAAILINLKKLKIE